MANQIDLINDIESTDIFISLKHNCPEQCVNDFGDVRKQLTIVNQNIRSILKNFDNFEIFLSRLNFLPDIIILTECRLHEYTPKVQLHGYECHYSQHYLNQNDGLAILYKSELNVTIYEPSFKDANCLVLSVGTEFTIYAIYRSPSVYNIRNFCESLETLLHTYNTPSMAIIGDINIDIKPGTEDRRASEYLDITGYHGFYPGHQYPTREYSCLDHALIKTKKNTKIVVCQSSLTDHDTVLIGISKETVSQTSVPEQTKYKLKFDYPSIVSEIENTDWSPILNSDDVTVAVNKFTEMVQNIINQHTKKEVLRNSKAIRRPWMTKGLLKCVRKRDALHSETKKQENKDNYYLQQKYKTYRNYCNNIIQNLKNAHDKGLLDSSKGDIKKTWAAVKTVCDFKNKKTNSFALLKANPDPVVSLNMVNGFFADVGTQLAEQSLTKLKKTETELADLVLTIDSTDPFLSQSFFMTPTVESEIITIIASLKNDSAPGWDGIPNRVFKLAQHCLARPISHLCNLSMSSGIVPAQLKTANICPIYKAGEASTPSNYRPISLLTSLSKILEKLVNKRLLTYLEKNKLLSLNQYGFRNGRSTEDAVSNLVDHVIGNLDSGKRCVGVFLDLAKAFDTVSRPILIKKMERIGIRGIALDWFASYLTERQQKVCLGDYQSNFAKVSFGVPQGSVLGPTMFLLYVNGLCSLNLDNAQLFAYADDTAIIFHGNSWKEAYSAADAGMLKVANWLQYNLLTLNVKKTKIVNFSVTNRTTAPNQFAIKFHLCNYGQDSSCSCPVFEKVDCIKYLGINIDERLSWTKQIELVTARVRKLLYIFKRLRSIADISTIKMTYQALCQSLLSYCIISWGFAGKSILLTAERAQRAILKVAFKLGIRYPTDSLYRETGVLTVRQLYILSVLLRFHKTAISTEVTDQRSRRRPKWNRASSKLKFGNKAYTRIGPYLYQKVNSQLNILPMTKFGCKKLVKNWLLGLNYNETEDILSNN